MAFPARFRTLARFLGPRWLVVDGESGKVRYSIELILDAATERVRSGLMARLPQNDPTGQTTAPEDALQAMGRDRAVVRGINESAQSYAARLVTWLDNVRTRGNPFTLMRVLSGYTGAGPAFRTVDVRGNWYSRDADGVESAILKQGNWDWDGDASGKRWSRFWVIIYPNGLWTPTGNEWGEPDCQDWGDPGHTWGSTATPEHSATVRALVNAWKPAGTRCVNIILAFDPASFDPSSPEPDGLWARWSKVVNGVRVPSRLDTARYWDGS